jgi:uncharacterized protein YndB with AHSA1/START domain
MMSLEDLTLDITQEIEIKAAPGTVFRSLTTGLSHIMGGDGTAMDFTLEEWPGGRWFRDLGNGQGHLWGFVQVIKPPTLLEITGPMFMSYPVAGHLQVRCAQIAGGTLVTLHHRAMGLIDPKHREGVNDGWRQILESIKQASEK